MSHAITTELLSFNTKLNRTQLRLITNAADLLRRAQIASLIDPPGKIMDVSHLYVSGFFDLKYDQEEKENERE